MRVRFLGGPCHNQYRHIPRPLPERMPVAVTTAEFYDPDDKTPIGSAIPIEHYQLRYAAPAGVYGPGRRPEHPVYVHPDYNGPAAW